MKMHRIMRDIARGIDPGRAYRNEMDRRREEDAPTRDYRHGDILRVMHGSERVCFVTVTGRLRDHSLEVTDGLGASGKITFVGHNDIRLYLKAGPDWRLVVRGVSLHKVMR